MIGVGSLVTFVRAGSGHWAWAAELAVEQWNATDSCVPPPGVGSSGSRLGGTGRVPYLPATHGPSLFSFIQNAGNIHVLFADSKFECAARRGANVSR